MKMLPVSLAFMLLCTATTAAVAQSQAAKKDQELWRNDSASEINRMIEEANVWDENGDQVYTCAEWKKYVNELFTRADRNRDGYVDKKEFETIKELAPQFARADLGYFDDNRDGRVSRNEFVDKPNPFFLRFDKKGSCKVTIDDVMNSVPGADTKATVKR
jgi:Ca2+-binding EF-hand superfamily protein